MSADPARRKGKVSCHDAPPRRMSFEGPRRQLVLSSGAPERTLEIGRAIGELLPEGAVLSLEGGLGAGKTLIAKGICAGLGVSDEVLSPSFVIAEEYAGAFPVLHFDLYRLDSVDEVARTGLFDAINGRNVVIVEWGDRLPAGVLDADIRIIMRIVGDTDRTITVESGERAVALLEGGPA